MRALMNTYPMQCHVVAYHPSKRMLVWREGANHTTFDNLFVSESRGTGMVVTRWVHGA